MTINRESVRKDGAERSLGGKYHLAGEDAGAGQEIVGKDKTLFSIDPSSIIEIDQVNGQILFKDSTGVYRMLIGVNGVGEVLAKLSQPGIDVLTADDSDLVWSTDFNSFKIVATGTVQIPAIASNNYNVNGESVASFVRVTHSIGHSPAVIAFDNTGVDKQPFSYQELLVAVGNNGTAITYIFTHTHDIISRTTYVQFRVTARFHGVGSIITGVSALTVRYYILQEQVE